MRRVILLFSLLAAFSLAAPAAYAGSNIQSAGNFGLGLHVGYPGNGLSANYFLTQKTSLQADLSLWFGGDWLGVGGRLDFLWWPTTLASWQFADLAWFWGPGVNVFSYSWKGSGSHDAYVGVGVELPIGIGFQFKKVPIDLNLEAVPVLVVVGEHGTGVVFGIAGGLNARWYF